MIPTTLQMDKVENLPFMLMAQCLLCNQWTEFEESQENIDIFIKTTCECSGKFKQSTLISKRTFRGKI